MNKPGLHRFSHEAMATTFEVIVARQERSYARQAADAAFEELDLTERALSRYRESSDIAQLNRTAKGVWVRVGLRTFECLAAARRVWEATDGAFDVTVGPLLACWRGPDKQPRTPSPEQLAAARARTGMDKVELDAQRHAVRFKVDGMQLDLGGIGKGFGLDRAAAVLDDWGVADVAINGGTSTVLALGAPEGEPGWALGVGGSGNVPRYGKIRLRGAALSGSGVEVQGRHICDPRTGEAVEGKWGAWCVCGCGAQADALSTALMVLNRNAVAAYCRAHPNTLALVLEQKAGAPRYRAWGPWTEAAGLELDDA